MKDREILFFKHAEGTLSEDEKLQVQKIVSESEQAVEELNLVDRLITLDTTIKAIQSYDTNKGFLKFQKRISRKYRFDISFNMLVRIAAILAIPLLISTFVLFYANLGYKNASDKLSLVSITTAPGLVSFFELPDGSQVWLNSGSMLTYPAIFKGEKREVSLTGEGYFKVKSDKEHPFFVTTQSGVKVMAHGTMFNVNAYSECDDIEIILEEGKVDALAPDQSVYQLLPGECALYNKEKEQMVIDRANIYEKTAWKDGKVIFRNATLAEVFKQIEKRYNIDVVLHDEKKMSKNYRCRVTFTHETIQQIFSYLEVAAPIKWKLSEPVQHNDATLFRQRVDVWLDSK